MEGAVPVCLIDAGAEFYQQPGLCGRLCARRLSCNRSKSWRVGDIQVLIQYVRNFNQPFTQTANMANLPQSTIAGGRSVYYLDEEEEPRESEHPVKLDHVEGKVGI